MPHIHVTCAIIERNGLVLVARRSALMQLPLKWEFPGGKIRAGEDPGECLKREIREELALEIDIAGELSPATHHYPDFIVTLYPFICKAKTSGFKLAEHAEAAWFPPGRPARLNGAKRPSNAGFNLGLPAWTGPRLTCRSWMHTLLRSISDIWLKTPAPCSVE